MPLNKTSNGYAEAISQRLYIDCPKAVLAAIAVSALTTGGDSIDEAEQRVLHEWWVLYRNGIVPQKPKAADPGDCNA